MKLHIELEIQNPEEIVKASEFLGLLKNFVKETPNSQLKPTKMDEVFRTLLQRLQDPNQIVSVSGEINRLFQQFGDSCLDPFFEMFVVVAFDPELITKNQSVVPYIQMLTKLNENYKIIIRDRLIPKVLKFLTIKRPLDTNRLEFFTYAEAFAALVKFEFAPITGAVITITTLLSKPETRSAAITMLGKTVELCLDQLLEKCDPSKLSQLRISLKNIDDVRFQYDIDYIEENMNWKETPSTTATSSTTASTTLTSTSTPSRFKPSSLFALKSFSGHSNTIFAICYDELNQELLSSGKDGIVIAWSKNGKPKQEIELEKHYACSMDMNPNRKSLYISGVAKNPKTNPAIIGYQMDHKKEWVSAGILEKQTVRLISCVKALQEDSGSFLVTGESTKNGVNEICLYDTSQGLLNQMNPLLTFREHGDIITSLAHFPGAEGLFFSGSRDWSIKLWDKRQPKSVATFGSVTGPLGNIVAHKSMITCLDALGPIMISGGLDKQVMVWDLRTLDSGGFQQPLLTCPIDDSVILKVAIGPGLQNSAAVSTVKGLYFVDFETGTSKIATPFQDQRSMSRYNDLKWNSQASVLYAGGDDMRVDVFAAK